MKGSAVVAIGVDRGGVGGDNGATSGCLDRTAQREVYKNFAQTAF